MESLNKNNKIINNSNNNTTTKNTSKNSRCINIQQSQQPQPPVKVVVKKEKAKRKNSEKRKEKSRKAARERRSQEAKIFDEIEEILPVPAKILDHLDKASLVRVAINYLKIRSVVDPFQVPNVIDSFDLADASFLNTLNGFMFVLSKDGDIIYLSENVERFLGLNQIDLMGQSLYDYSHPCDHDDIKSLLEPLINAFNASKLIHGNGNNTVSLVTNNNNNNNAVQQNNGIKKSENDEENLIVVRNDQQQLDGQTTTAGPYFIRMKCTLTNKGRNLNLKSANYKVIKCRGRMIDLEVANPKHAQMIGENYRHYMIVVGEIIQHPIRMDMPLKSDAFVSKHLPNMKFAYVDESVKELFGYDVNDLIGTSFYQYFDANDFTQLSILFKTLFAKGQCDFGQYKFLVKTGGYRWISTQATIINEPNSNKPQSIILIHRVISNVENGHLLTSDVQKGIATANNINVIPGTVTPATISIPIIAVPEIINTPIFNPSAISATSLIIKAASTNKTAPTTTPIAAITAILDPNIVNQKIPELSNINDSVPNIIATNPQSQQLKVKVEEEQDSNELLVQQPEQFREPQSVTDQFVSSTETVLAPKTADMESGFLMFTEDNKGLTVLSDADDLTHLAPDAGDLAVPMMPDMDFADMNIFDEIFLNSTSFNITTNGAGALSEDEFLNNLASLDTDKLKLDGLDSFNLEFDTGGGGLSSTKKFPNENLLGINNKDLKSSVYDQQYPLDVDSNDPFLSFTNPNNNDEFLINDSPATRSSNCSLNESFMSSSNSNSPMNSSNSSSSPSSSNSLQYSPKSMSCEDTSSRLCDSDEQDLEMRAPFIPIDDDYLLNDFSYSNLDDLFDWVSNSNNDGNNSHNNNNNINNNSNNNNMKPKSNSGGGGGGDLSYRHHQTKRFNGKINNNFNNNKNKTSNLLKLNGGCLEALLQNDELICNLKNKMYSSNQILNKEQVLLDTIATTPANIVQQQNIENSNNGNNTNNNVAFSTFIADPNNKTTTTMKRKNSNIFVYTTMSNTGEKKIKNLILTPEIPAHKLNGMNGNNNNISSNVNQQNGTTTSIHHFVLTKNNELIPKVTFLNQQQLLQQQQQQQQQSFKVPKRLFSQESQLQQQQQPPLPPLSVTVQIPNNNSNNVTPNTLPTTPHLQQISNGLQTTIINGADHSKESIKENVFKKPRSDFVKNFSSNSVLLNLLVNGSDLSNGYELTQSSPTNNTFNYNQSQQQPTRIGISQQQQQQQKPQPNNLDRFIITNNNCLATQPAQ